MAAFVVPDLNVVRLAVLPNRNASGSTAASAARRGAPARVRWWWGLLLATVAADGAARALALRTGMALDLGPVLQAVIVGQLLAAAAAVVGISVVHGVDARQEAAAWSRIRRARWQPRFVRSSSR
jgi:hypothetical protein